MANIDTIKKMVLFILLFTCTFSLMSLGNTIHRIKPHKSGNGEQAIRPNFGHRPVKSPQSFQQLSLDRRQLIPTANAVSGVKWIGTGKDYATIAAAVADMNQNGISSPVTFLLADSQYTETGILVLPIIGGSSENTVTMMPDSNRSSVRIDLIDDAEMGGGIVLAGVSYFTIDGTKKNGPAGTRNLTIRFQPGQPFPAGLNDAVLRLEQGVTYTTIKNCTIYSMYDGAEADARPGIMVSTSGPPNKYISIVNNRIAGASYGIWTVGGDEYDVGIQVIGNEIGGAFGPNGGASQSDYCDIAGMRIEWVDSATILHNTVKGVRRNISATDGDYTGHRTAGIWMNYGVNSMIGYNLVDDVRSIYATTSSASDTRIYGMRIIGNSVGSGNPYPRSNNHIFNNSVTNVHGTGTTAFRDFCFSGEIAEGDTLYYNSFYHTGSDTGGAVVVQLTGDNTTSGDYALYNNIFAIDRTGDGVRCAYRPFNNSGEPDIRKADNNVVYVSGATATIDANGIPTLREWTIAKDLDAQSSPDNPRFTSTSDLHLLLGLPSAAEGLGHPIAGYTDDYDGNTRSLTTPDAGFDEAAAMALDKDVSPTVVVGLPANGLPYGLPATTTIIVTNFTRFTVGAFNVTMVIKNELDVTVPGGGTVSCPGLAPFASDTVKGFTAFTPNSDGPYTITAISQLTNDMVPSNDTLRATAPIVPKIIVPAGGYTTCFETGGDQKGWAGTGDFALDSGFTKLGGPYQGAGTYSWVTNPGPPGTHYTEGGVLNLVLSPFFDLSAMTTDVYISFVHSINTEPKWDFSTFQYSTDGGNTWHTVGVQNDPNGVNWYSSSLYNSMSDDASGCLDTATWNPATGNFPYPLPIWSSLGDCNGADLPLGPTGWIFTQLKFNTIVGNPFVRFRYLAWSDAATGFDGWAFDCFKILPTGASFPGGSIAGSIFIDTDGNGAKDPGEPKDSGVKIAVDYFGVPKDTVTSAPNGNFTVGVDLPGEYGLSVVKPGWVVTMPAAGKYSVTHPADGSNLSGYAFGDYQGGVSGKVYSDANHNRHNDGEPGLSGWTVQVHDSATGDLSGSATTDTNGNYMIPAKPGAYTVNEVGTKDWRQTEPTGGQYAVTIGGTSGSGTALLSGKDLGNYSYGQLRIELTIDLNGNGVKDAGDVFALPFGARALFTVTKNGLPYDTVHLGNTDFAATVDSLDPGIYRIEETGIPSGWMQTAGGVQGVVTRIIDTGGFRDVSRYLNFDLNIISGHVFSDTNDNGVKDAGEPMLGGWIIRLSGASTASTVTDTAGYYEFNGLGPGSYTVSESLKTGWRRTLPTGGGTYAITANGLNNIKADKDFGNKLIMVAVNGQDGIPKEFQLHQNYPNPFNPTTSLRYALPTRSQVKIAIFNILGQTVATLVDAEQGAGYYSITWEPVSGSGIYFYRMQAVSSSDPQWNFTQVKKMLLLK